MIRSRRIEILSIPLATLALSVWSIGCSSGTPSTQASTGNSSSAGSASSGNASASGASTTGAASGVTTTTSGVGSGTVSTGSAASGTGVTSGTSAGTGTLATSGTIGSSGTTGGSGSATSGGGDLDGGSVDDGSSAVIDAAGRTPATCAKATPSPNGARPSECDYLLQSLDFEDTLGYPSPAGSIKVTNFGTAFGLFAVNNCSPYCYSKNLTVGIDISGSDPSSLQGEIIAELPQMDGGGLPITTADMTRNALAWITFDGAAKPPFEIDTQMIVETTAGVIASVEDKTFFKANGNLAPFGPFNVTNNYSYDNGCEFKYFPFTSATGFPNGAMNVTGIGFRIVAKATAGQSWHGVAYIDHLQIRAPNPDNPPGTYPYGLN
jgi:hypothetical protein